MGVGLSSCFHDAQFQRVLAALDPGFLQRLGVTDMVAEGRMEEARNQLASWFRMRADPAYFPDIHERPAAPVSGYDTRSADAIVKHSFLVSEGRRENLGDPVDWHAATLTSEEKNVVDRHPWVQTLARAYWNTYDSTYLIACIDLLRSWRAAHPPPPRDHDAYRVASYRGLEMGMRLPHWIEALHRFRDAPELSDDDVVFLLSLIEESADRLGRIFANGNHGTKTNSGLAYASIFFPEFQHADDWLDRALVLLEVQLEHDILGDSFAREMAPGYHINMMGDFLKVQRAAELNDIAVSELYDERIEGMHEVLMHIAKPNCRTPLLNDSGGGAYYRPWMAFASVRFGRPDFKFVCGGADLAFIEGYLGGVFPEEHAAFEAMIPVPPASESVALHESGHYVMRSGWTPEAVYLLVEAGRRGPHGHRDAMNVDMYAHGRSMLVDPGMADYSSDPAILRFLGSGEAHNTVTIDGVGVSMSAENVFWHSSSDFDVFSGETEIGRNVRWERTIVFVKPEYWILLDQVHGSRVKNAEVRQLWHYVPGQVDIDEDGARAVVRYSSTGERTGQLMLQWDPSKRLQYTEPLGYLARAVAGDRAVDADPATRVADAPYLAVAQSEPRRRITFPSVLYPYEGQVPDIEVSSLRVGTSNLVRVEHGSWTDEVLVVKNDGVRLGDYRTTGQGIAIVQYFNGVLERVELFGIISLTLPDGITVMGVS